MSNRVVATLAAWVALWTSTMSWAYEMEDVRIEFWTGSGPNQVLLVVDFWPGNGQADSFAFGYQFSAPQITGLDLLNALQAANQGFSYAPAGGSYVTDIWYVMGGTTYHVGEHWPNSWWKYFTSADFGTTWAASDYGLTQRILVSGDSDGWLALPGDDWTSVPVTPVLGDMNCDGTLSLADINPFVLALSNADAYEAAFPTCPLWNADINGDGTYGQWSFGDINPFVALFGR
jgi:hypothetical protein